jgi:hypothetical protein
MRSSTLTIWLVGVAVLGVVLAAGCQAPSQPSGPTVERVSLPAPADRDQLWEAAGQTLRDYAFRLDRQDKVNGVVTTLPETTAQGFEFWRPQPRPAYYWWEANLHTIQRQATVQLLPGENADETRLDVKIERLRYRLEERQVDNAAGTMRIFSADAPTVSGKRAKPSKTGYWVPLGRDELLEQKLLAAILRNYAKRTGLPASQPAITH